MFQLLRIVEHIIRNMKDEDLIFSEKASGFTPLHFAAVLGEYRVVHLLLQRNAIANFKDRSGQLPLQLALCDDYDVDGGRGEKETDKIAAALVKETSINRSEIFVKRS